MIKLFIVLTIIAMIISMVTLVYVLFDLIVIDRGIDLFRLIKKLFKKKKKDTDTKDESAENGNTGASEDSAGDGAEEKTQ